MNTFRIALDWTPNINHIGFFVAREMGFYQEQRLEVELLDPSSDNYGVTPAKKVELNHADIALCPFESIISYRTKQRAFDAIAVATLFQEDLSAIVVLSESPIERPNDLDGCSYASYKARYEDEIVRQMVINDGGVGDLKLFYPEKLGIWNTLLTKKYDSTWIFMNWEGMQAEQQGVQLRSFRLADYDIPYGYSPVLMASNEKISRERAAYEKFLRATKKGFLFVKQNPEKAVAYLAPHVSAHDADINLVKSLQRTIPAYGPDKDWGQMKNEKIQQFLNWLSNRGLESAQLKVQQLVQSDLDF